jgi:hypothetical protein
LAIFHQGPIRRRLSEIADYTSVMTHIFIRYALMACYGDAYQLLRHGKYLSVILERCHSSPYGGQYGAFRINAMV